MKPLNADEVFRMAERVEANAADFYTKAANLHADRKDAEFLRGLAAMEREHRDAFAAMRKKLPAEARAVAVDYPYLKATIYLNRIADAFAGEGRLSLADPLTASDPLDVLIRKGIGFEKEAILFYLGLKEMVPEDLGRDQVDRIIADEKRHLVRLTEELARVTGTGMA